MFHYPFSRSMTFIPAQFHNNKALKNHILDLTEDKSGHGYDTRSYMYPIQDRVFPSVTAQSC